MNRQRSVTAERLYQNDARLEVRSAGVRSGAQRRVATNDLEWADLVFVMEREHQQWITKRFRDLDLPPIEVLDIPDEFALMDPRLQEMLKSTLDPEFEQRTRSLNCED